MNKISTILKNIIQKTASVMTHENITLVSLLFVLPVLVWTYTGIRLAVLTLVVINFALYFYANRGSK